MILHFEPANYLRIEEPRTIDTSAAGASFATSTGDILEVTSLGPGVFRLRLGPNARNDYGIVVGRSKACTVAQPRPGVMTFTAGEATLQICGGPLRFDLAWRGKPILGSTTDETTGGATRLPTFGRIRQGGEWTASFALASGEQVYGLGAKPGPLDKRGQIIHSQVEDPLTGPAGASGGNVPFAWSIGQGHGAWGVFVHTPGRVAHGVGFPDWSQRSYAVVVDDDTLDLLLFAADTPAGVLERYTGLTGRAAEVPRWSLGLWMSRVHDQDSGETLAAAERMREQHLPCDVIVANARSTQKEGFDFGFSVGCFSDPSETCGALHELDFRVCARQWPHVPVADPLCEELAQREFLLKNGYGEPCVVSRRRSTGPARTEEEGVAIVDFTRPAADAWWQDAHRELFASGVDAILCEGGHEVPEEAFAHNGDSGRRLHNVYPLLYGRAAHQATRRFAVSEEGAVIAAARAAWAGQQHALVGFDADAQSDWEGLAAAIRKGLSWGMSGHALHGSRVGGSYGARSSDPELFVRWLQASVFGSHLCVHCTTGRELWDLGADAVAVARKWLVFRYRLIPYLEETIRSAARTGLPVMRAMSLAFPANALTRRYETQFMCGDALLVAPIVRRGGEVEIALPPGGWYDLNSRIRHAGRQVLRYKATLDQFPVFGREGHVLALGPAVQHTAALESRMAFEQLWVFGTPTVPFKTKEIEVEPRDGAAPGVRVAKGIDVQCFGEKLPVGSL